MKRLVAMLGVIVLVSMMSLVGLSEEIITNEHLEWAYRVLDAFQEAGFECEGDMREYDTRDLSHMDQEKKPLIVAFRQIKGAGLALTYQNGTLRSLALNISKENENTDEHRKIYTVFLRAALNLNEEEAVFLENMLYLGLKPSMVFDTLKDASVDLDPMTASLMVGSMMGSPVNEISLIQK